MRVSARIMGPEEYRRYADAKVVDAEIIGAEDRNKRAEQIGNIIAALVIIGLILRIIWPSSKSETAPTPTTTAPAAQSVMLHGAESTVVTATSEGSEHVVFDAVLTQADRMAGVDYKVNATTADADSSCFIAVTPLLEKELCPAERNTEPLGLTPEIWFKSLDGTPRKILVWVIKTQPAST